MHVLQNLAVEYMKEEGKKCVIFFLGIPIVACLPWLCSLFHKIHFFLYFETFIYLSPPAHTRWYTIIIMIYMCVCISTEKFWVLFMVRFFFRIHCYCGCYYSFFCFVLYSHNPTRPVAIILIEIFWYYIIIIISGYKVLHNGKLMEL